MAEVVWLGDEDPAQQIIQQYGYTFVKGEPTKVPDSDQKMDKFKSMPVFHVGKGGAEVVESKEPDAVDAEAGTEKASVKAELDRLGVKYDGRATLEKLRDQLSNKLESLED